MHDYFASAWQVSAVLALTRGIRVGHAAPSKYQRGTIVSFRVSGARTLTDRPIRARSSSPLARIASIGADTDRRPGGSPAGIVLILDSRRPVPASAHPARSSSAGLGLSDPITGRAFIVDGDTIVPRRAVRCSGSTPRSGRPAPVQAERHPGAARAFTHLQQDPRHRRPPRRTSVTRVVTVCSVGRTSTRRSSPKLRRSPIDTRTAGQPGRTHRRASWAYGTFRRRRSRSARPSTRPISGIR